MKMPTASWRQGGHPHKFLYFVQNSALRWEAWGGTWNTKDWRERLYIKQKMVLAIADKHHFLRLTEKSVEMKKSFYL